MTTLEKKSRPEAEYGGPYDVSTGAPASTSTCATTDASVHAFADDPDIASDRRGRHQLGSAVDSELIRLPSAFSRSRLGLNKLLQVSSTSREWPHQVGLADVNFDLADIQIDPAEVLPGRVRNLLGLRISAAPTSASGGASLASSLVVFMMMFLWTLLLALHCVPSDVPGSWFLV